MFGDYRLPQIDEEASPFERQGSRSASPIFSFGIREPKWMNQTMKESPQKLWPRYTSKAGRLVVVLLLLVFLSLSWQGFHALPKPSSLRILASSSTRSYLGPANITAHLKNDLYPTKLGKKLIILDVDSRPWNINDSKKMTQLDWGRLNHYLYAQNHGYDYRYIQTPNPPQDTHATWVKVEAIAKVLQEGYKFVVFTDSDVMFPWLNLPLEYLLSEWNVTSDIAITAGYAPDEPNKYDHTHKRRNINSGFMVVQDTSITAQLFKDWIECPTNVKYPECSHWKDEYWHEQSAYSDFVRHDYIDHVRELSCNDVNGGPQHPLEGDKKCSGKYVRHYWYDKNKVKDAVLESIADTVVPGAVEGLSEYFYKSARVAS